MYIKSKYSASDFIQILRHILRIKKTQKDNGAPGLPSQIQ